MYKGNAIQSLLENSSTNGFSFLVVVVLFYLFLFFLIQYFHHKKLFYLLYSLYAFINGISLIRQVKGVFFSSFFESQAGLKFKLFTHYPAQLLGTIFFTYFIIEIMKLRNNYPKSIRVIDHYYKTISIVYTTLWIISNIKDNPYIIHSFLSWVLLPLNLISLLWISWMVYNQNIKIKWYIFSGMLVLSLSFLILSFITMGSTGMKDEHLSIFYIGILIESMLFALAIGLEQKMIYQENIAIQKKYIVQLEENQVIKESMNRTLSKELEQTKSDVLEITVEAQKERTEKLTAKFENRFSQLRLNALRSQMNPHFIFNALNSIKAYFIENDQEKAIFYLNKFSKLIRNILENSREEQISLANELETITMYTEIENDRFQNNIQFHIEIDKKIDTQSIKVPALFLLPFVENAIWHGLATKKNSKELNIRVVKDIVKKNILITIQDNGIGTKASKEKNKNNPLKKESIGLTLTKDRLDLFSRKFNKPYSFTIKDLVDNQSKKVLGTIVTILIPENI